MAADLSVLRSGRRVPGCDNGEEQAREHHRINGGSLRFRFPPEPNGFLHIGHAKSMHLNFGSAVVHKGECYLRYDDTNPDAEDELYVASIERMVRWMGWSPTRVTHSSDCFEQLFAFALKLIREGHAYVDHSTGEEVKRQREERRGSMWRDRPAPESERLFWHMRQGRFGEGEATLRLKMDMSHDNPNMRDIIAYRVKYRPHPHTHNTWCVYPSYDYTHCIVDSLEHIDFSLCTLEFETRRESYFWLLDRLQIWKPCVWEFSRLNVTGALLSKRKINVLVKEGIVRGFDDPRLLTLAGLRRRGYTPQAINDFCERVSITRTLNVIQSSQLEASLREDLDRRAPRRMLLPDPVRLRLINLPAPLPVTCSNHPRGDEGTRSVSLTPELYIDRSDFRETDTDKHFFGLAPGGRPVGLKYAGTIVLQGVEKDGDGRVACLVAEYDHERRVRPKTNISWVGADGLPVEIRTYRPLLTSDEAATSDAFLAHVDADSEAVSVGRVEPCVSQLAVFDVFQAERFAYFVKDPDSTPQRLVLNMTVALREDKKKAPTGGSLK